MPAPKITPAAMMPAGPQRQIMVTAEPIEATLAVPVTAIPPILLELEPVEEAVSLEDSMNIMILLRKLEICV